MATNLKRVNGYPEILDYLRAEKMTAKSQYVMQMIEDLTTIVLDAQASIGKPVKQEKPALSSLFDA